MSDSTKIVLDAASFGTVVSTIAGWLPAVAALFSVIWTIVRIYETRTVQTLLGHGAPGRRPECSACTVRNGGDE